MKPSSRVLLVGLITMLVTIPARAQVFTMDIQALVQTMALKAIGQDQVGALGQIFGVNTEQLQASQRINDILGSRSLSQIGDLTGFGMQDLLKSVPGLENVNIGNLFPPNVGGAFLGRSFDEWKELVGNPSSVFAGELRRMAVGDLLSGSGLKSDEKSLLTYLASGNSSSKGGQAYVATTLSRLLTSRLLESVETQAQQAAVYAAQKQRFSEQAKKDLTLTDRAKLGNNQEVLSIELQLQQMQAQNQANAAHATQLDSQTRLLEEQIEFQEVDRASR